MQNQIYLKYPLKLTKFIVKVRDQNIQFLFTKKNSIKIKVEKNKIYSNLKLNNGDYKKIKTSHKSNLKSTSLYLYKGKNILVIEWPVSSDKMVIYRK